MTQRPILVLGGTGKTGRRVAAHLSERGHPVRALSRSTGQRFDWHDTSTWDAALRDVRSAYVVEPGTADAPETVRAFAERAAAQGVQRLALLSFRQVEEPEHAHYRAIEQAVRDSGAGWTMLRPDWFAQNFSEDFFREGVLAGGLRLPTGDGAVPFVDAEDIAAVAAAVLTEDGHDGRVYEITGPRLLTLADALAEIARAGGPAARFTHVEAGDFRADLGRQGWPAEAADVVTALLDGIRRGRNASVSDGVRQVLGREPADFADYAKAAAAAGAWRDRPAG
ncbi:NmrA family NAD(P)-binding protein [Marinitenerispora sediminis]|uniref:NAD(P)-dependent oxidoreductase n=1 Tax=Marinitenerispora sediminis TaxID=1931232 RepID=A0A368TA08_9ACTN|nr:NAD(P)H-binding protein [Marinitenerispora sediminis]RCV52917.1 NAD(P)-dependent oxidoreductase [Marinitenerispora sediminis]RCV60734.1 NAD(P)-dependent oxidoreductase [Marinitenerispora sediminis]RCV61596.1 NAD(P)-dependent oxidoreductase [Marinitenerispora sediminis]